MPELSHRLAVAALLVAGLLTAVPLLFPAEASLSLPVVQHRQFMQAMLAAGVVLAAFLPALRPAAIGAAALSNGAFSAMALLAGPGPAWAPYAWPAAASLVPLLFAGLVLAREARQQARWEGVLPLRQGV